MGTVFSIVRTLFRASAETPGSSLARLPWEQAETLIFSLTIKNCPECCLLKCEFKSEDYYALLKYRVNNNTLPADIKKIDAMNDVFSCILSGYLSDARNFTFAKVNSALFDPEMSSLSTPPDKISSVHMDWMKLRWEKLKKEPETLAEILYSSRDYENYGYFDLYSKLLEDISSEDVDKPYPDIIYSSHEQYRNWLMEEFLNLVEESGFTKDAFFAWKKLIEKELTESTNDNIEELIKKEPSLLYEFFNEIQGLWNEDKEKYFWVPLSILKSESIKPLKNNNSDSGDCQKFNCYLKVMEQDYYEEGIWMGEIYPYFSTSWTLVIEYNQEWWGTDSSGSDGSNPSVKGNKSEQDALWRWVEENKEKLEFDSDSQKWIIP